MNVSLKKGMVIKLEENSDKKYIIIEKLEEENKIYLLLTDCEGQLEENGVKNLRIDYDKMFMARYDEITGEVEYDSNKEILTKLVTKTLNFNKK